MITYHDNNIYPQYGEDHKLLNNWDPNKDYGNEYASVYFRIETPSYYHKDCYGVGFDDDVDRAAFTADKLKVFEAIGWNCDKSDNNGCCMTVVKGKQELYLHPQEFSGVILKSEVKKIAEALEKNDTFYLRWVDIYSTVYDVSDAHYRHMLDGNMEKMRREIIEKAKTKRRSAFRYEWGIIDAVANNCGFARVGDRSTYQHDKCTHDYVREVIDDLVSEGYIIRIMTDDGYPYIRSLNKTEMKKAKLQEVC